MTVQPSAFATRMAMLPMPEPPACTRIRFARFKSRVVEQHVVDGGIGHSDTGGVAQIDRVGHLDQSGAPGGW